MRDLVDRRKLSWIQMLFVFAVTITKIRMLWLRLQVKLTNFLVGWVNTMSKIASSE